MKPSTYMNDSGKAILDCFNYYNLSAENLIVICDDIDIPFGTIRIKKERLRRNSQWVKIHHISNSISRFCKNKSICRSK